MDAWAVLGIAPTADVAAIRRAYARRLKLNRPDEDPEGFQRLLRARDAALGEAAAVDDRRDVEEPDAEQDDAPPPPALDPDARPASGGSRGHRRSCAADRRSHVPRTGAGCASGAAGAAHRRHRGGRRGGIARRGRAA
jgi:hypothetical protein